MGLLSIVATVDRSDFALQVKSLHAMPELVVVHFVVFELGLSEQWDAAEW